MAVSDFDAIFPAAAAAAAAIGGEEPATRRSRRVYSTWTPVEEARLLEICLDEGVWTARYPEKMRTKERVAGRFNTWLRETRPYARPVTTHIWWQHWRTSLSSYDPDELERHARTLDGVAALCAALRRTRDVQNAVVATERARSRCSPHTFQVLNEQTIYCERCGKLVHTA